MMLQDEILCAVGWDCANILPSSQSCSTLTRWGLSLDLFPLGL